MLSEVENWLAKYYETSLSEIPKLIKSEEATSFLLIWSLFESKIANGYFQKSQISTISSKISDLSNIEIHVEYFHDRYQDSQKWNNLKHQDNAPVYDAIRLKNFESISDTEKLTFILYVVFRYRNNIFHGNKGIDSWLKYQSEIQKCILVMIEMLNQIIN